MVGYQWSQMPFIQALEKEMCDYLFKLHIDCYLNTGAGHVQYIITPYCTIPDLAFCNVRASKSVIRQTLWSSELPFQEFWYSKMVAKNGQVNTLCCVSFIPQYKRESNSWVTWWFLSLNMCQSANVMHSERCRSTDSEEMKLKNVRPGSRL